jgi:hypothetical protein
MIQMAVQSRKQLVSELVDGFLDVSIQGTALTVGAGMYEGVPYIMANNTFYKKGVQLNFSVVPTGEFFDITIDLDSSLKGWKVTKSNGTSWNHTGDGGWMLQLRTAWFEAALGQKIARDEGFDFENENKKPVDPVVRINPTPVPPVPRPGKPNRRPRAR